MDFLSWEGQEACKKRVAEIEALIQRRIAHHAMAKWRGDR